MWKAFLTFAVALAWTWYCARMALDGALPWWARHAYREGWDAGSHGEPYANPYRSFKRRQRYMFGWNKGHAWWNAQPKQEREQWLDFTD
jgi:hypothetical protein